MDTLSSKPNHVRSISLPGRSHPTTQRVEEELNKLKSLEVSVAPAAVSNGLLVGLLDLCGTIRELVSQCKENVRDLQSSLRRRKGDLTIDDSIERFTSFIKKIKRDAKRLVSALKQMDQETAVSVLLDADQDTVAVIRALKEANSVCISTFQMLLSFLCVPLLKPKPSKWSLLSRMVNKERIAPLVLEENMSLETRLESFEANLVSFEDGLEATFRCLIRSRSSLLNVFSC
ncbi:uncharacterized protein LOC132624635 [Lycium barbarum]|uniref:uncharacterized protein LOC132624635 n=1 Tax=Lycium barbarum TaxID=112863 RepID=UPI00293F2AB9|nr:uncharacterized protein LOC132624635 [Lycium barbarum]